VLDSGASFHTTPHQEIIRNYVAGEYGVAYLADGEPLKIVGIGDKTGAKRICMAVTTGETCT
jgi:hypothetical protein